MHHCPDCRWSGEVPLRLAGAQRLAALEALTPGAIVPSGLCPKCNGLALPADIGPFPVPEGADENANEPWEGWRWQATISLTRSALVVELSDRLLPRYAELAIDASGQRPRIEISCSAEGTPYVEQEPQLSLSLGDGVAAAFPSTDPVAQPLLFTDRGLRQASPLTRHEFDVLDRWIEPILEP